MNIFIMSEMRRGKQRTKIMSKLDFHLEVCFDAETYLYHNTPQALCLKFQHLKLFRKKKNKICNLQCSSEANLNINSSKITKIINWGFNKICVYPGPSSKCTQTLCIGCWSPHECMFRYSDHSKILYVLFILYFQLNLFPMSFSSPWSGCLILFSGC